jgi:PHD/YefM family antitoxin component YafN of YafNO toxin-antitoxin module
MTGFAHKQFIVDDKGKQVAVVLDLATYEKFLEAIEELEDIRAYDEAKDRVRDELQTGEYVTLKEYMKTRQKRIE